MCSSMTMDSSDHSRQESNYHHSFMGGAIPQQRNTMHKSLENDLQHIFATSATDNQDGTKPEEEPDEPIETYHIYPAQGGILITKEEVTEPVVDSTPPVKRPSLFSFIPVILSSLLLLLIVI